MNKCSVSCSAYTQGDYLLVHDDLESDRCVAFILYLTGLDEDKNDIWRPEYGGALEMFDMDGDGQPTNVRHKFYPSHNQFTFFQVRKHSYHQVSIG